MHTIAQMLPYYPWLSSRFKDAEQQILFWALEGIFQKTEGKLYKRKWDFYVVTGKDTGLSEWVVRLASQGIVSVRKSFEEYKQGRKFTDKILFEVFPCDEGFAVVRSEEKINEILWFSQPQILAEKKEKIKVTKEPDFSTEAWAALALYLTLKEKSKYTDKIEKMVSDLVKKYSLPVIVECMWRNQHNKFASGINERKWVWDVQYLYKEYRNKSPIDNSLTRNLEIEAKAESVETLKKIAEAFPTCEEFLSTINISEGYDNSEYIARQKERERARYQESTGN